MTTLKVLIKDIQFRTPLRKYLLPSYELNFTPVQLSFLCQCLEQTKDCAGAIAEVGCARGLTTIFLSRFLDGIGSQKTYFAVDTFHGFVPADVDFEVNSRGKRRGIYTGFSVNRQEWFDATMRRNNISRVRSIKADVNVFDLTTLGDLSFVLLDVDLYRPMKKSLSELYGQLSPGGIMVVDDCSPKHSKFDGADQAYREFAAEVNQPIEVVHGKLGVVRNQA